MTIDWNWILLILIAAAAAGTVGFFEGKRRASNLFMDPRSEKFRTVHTVGYIDALVELMEGIDRGKR